MEDYLGKYFESYKGRNVLPGQRVEVYRNLKFKDTATYSVRDAKTGLVLGHAQNLLLSRCLFIVNNTGRKRVLREKKKNVHAWINGSFGILHAGDDKIFSEGVKVTYNPYKNITFVHEDYGYQQHILMANVVYISDHGVVASGL